MSSDSHLRIFDLRTPSSASNHLTLTIPLHGPSSPPSEALTHDWNKYRSTIVAAAGVDRQILTFDVRASSQGALTILPGHDYAVRKLAWSPHVSDMLLSASYDMTCRVWTDGTPSPNKSQNGGEGREMGRMDQHTEFVVGVDWCLFGAEGWCASCGWDEKVLIWDVASVM